MLLHVTDLRVDHRVVVPFKLPHHAGSLIRGLLGRALRRTGCRRGPSPCPGACQRPAECAYARLFDPVVPSPSPHRFLQPGREAPPRLLPVLPPMRGVDLRPGESLAFGVRVLGTLDDDGERRLSEALEGIADLPIGTSGGQVEPSSVARHGRRNREVIIPDSNAADPGLARVRVTFETPAWIEQDKKLVESLTFSALFRAVYRRLTILAALYGELEEDDGSRFAKLDALAAEVDGRDSYLRVLRWERLSEERGERHGMRGIVGWAEFEGRVQALMPILAAGEVVHIGKATGFGLGRMQVSVHAE